MPGRQVNLRLKYSLFKTGTLRIQVAAGGGIEHGSIRNFLLEKSRIVTQESEERGYHIFYQFLKGATSEQTRRYHLKGLKGYKFINPKCPDAAGIVRQIQETVSHNDSSDTNATAHYQPGRYVSVFHFACVSE